ncbi:hypothetical protein Ciccas_002131 [Cichlidogyrus casuarinus]|uniref:Phospholipase A2-like central domain-containing protein n=1 Tax=Cichlidogyrus casuarinus TaxID=1844966 RepID=A0ABD2QIH2_9PLAT
MSYSTSSLLLLLGLVLVASPQQEYCRKRFDVPLTTLSQTSTVDGLPNNSCDCVIRFHDEKNETLLQITIDPRETLLQCSFRSMTQFPSNHNLSEAIREQCSPARRPEAFDKRSIVISKASGKINSTEGSAFQNIIDGLIKWPGTKWCGPGNNAQTDDDYGEFVDTDKCCQQHDYCVDSLLPGASKNGFTNPYTYTISSCECDDMYAPISSPLIHYPTPDS